MMNKVIGFDGVYSVGLEPSRTPACGGAFVPFGAGATPALARMSASISVRDSVIVAVVRNGQCNRRVI